jgi:hypothetical protein
MSRMVLGLTSNMKLTRALCPRNKAYGTRAIKLFLRSSSLQLYISTDKFSFRTFRDPDAADRSWMMCTDMLFDWGMGPLISGGLRRSVNNLDW